VKTPNSGRIGSVATLEKHVGDHTPVGIQGALVLKLAQMMQFWVEILRDEGNMLTALCKMVTKGK